MEKRSSETQLSQGNDMREKNYLSPARIFFILAASIYGIELLIMVAFMIAPPLPDVLETIIDATSLTLLAAPVIYFFAIRPLYGYLNRTQQLSNQYEELTRVLEGRVEERTQELQSRTTQMGEQTQELGKANLLL